MRIPVRIECRRILCIAYRKFFTGCALSMETGVIAVLWEPSNSTSSNFRLIKFKSEGIEL